MFTRRIIELGYPIKFLVPNSVMNHSKTCPAVQRKVCPGSRGESKRPPGGSSKGPGIKRAEKSGPTRFGFIPEDWFLFFYPKTGVTGPYLFGLALGNYLLSKEIYVLEHEYYLGLSIGAVTIFVVQKFGHDIGASLDNGVDEILADWNKERVVDIEMHNANIAAAKAAQDRAQGQQLLMHAKKENIAMQLEAAYRERAMLVYRTVKGRMDYHLKTYKAEARIQQKWMIGWILENVRKSITPEFEKQALDRAIQDLAMVASKA